MYTYTALALSRCVEDGRLDERVLPVVQSPRVFKGDCHRLVSVDCAELQICRRALVEIAILVGDSQPCVIYEQYEPGRSLSGVPLELRILMEHE